MSARYQARPGVLRRIVYLMRARRYKTLDREKRREEQDEQERQLSKGPSGRTWLSQRFRVTQR